MQVADNLYKAGLDHYVDALFAIGCFERVIVEEAGRIIEQKRNALAEAFGVEKLHGGGEYRNRPDFNQIRSQTLDTFWAWIGRDCWIPNLSNCFFGICTDNGKPVATIMLRKHDRRFRETLLKTLKHGTLKHCYDIGSGEIVISRSLGGSSSVKEFGATLTSLIDELIGVLREEAPFIALAGSNDSSSPNPPPP
jgi:hypothetical protein